MIVVERLVRAVAVIALAFAYISSGFLVCVAPATVHAVSNATSDDVTSPLDRTELTIVADATRDYAFGSHDLSSLYAAIVQVDNEYRDATLATGGKLPSNFPRVQSLGDNPTIGEYAAAFSGASEQFSYDPQVIKHLDDCYSIAIGAYIAVALGLIVAIGATIFSGIRSGKRILGSLFLVAGICVIVLLVLTGLWALIDFNGFFANFHLLFFSQGNWRFAANSLLICALPTAFWMSLGGIWLATTLVVSILSIGVGLILSKITLRKVKKAAKKAK